MTKACKIVNSEDAELVSMLQAQLEKNSIKPIEEFVDYDTARREFEKAIARLMDGDETATGEVEKWSNFVELHPVRIEEMRQLQLKWIEDNQPKNTEALRVIRRFVAPSIFSCKFGDLLERGLPKNLAKRIWDMKVLWLTRCEESFIAKIHAADLKSKYAFHMLDITELRAVWAVLPKEFENDQTGEKAEWKANVLQKLQNLVTKDDKEELRGNQLRHVSYKDLSGFYDPDAAIAVQVSQASTAFAATEVPVPSVKKELSGSADAAVVAEGSAGAAAGGGGTVDATDKAESSTSPVPTPVRSAPKGLEAEITKRKSLNTANGNALKAAIAAKGGGGGGGNPFLAAINARGNRTGGSNETDN